MNYHVIDNIDINNYTDLTEQQVEKLLNKLMSEPDFRRGDLETTVDIEYSIIEDSIIEYHQNKEEIEVKLGLFDVWGGDDNEDGDVWGDYPTKIYKVSDL